MRVHIGGDHAAYDLKCTLVTFLQGKGYDVVDHGPEYFDAQERVVHPVGDREEQFAGAMADPYAVDRGIFNSHVDRDRVDVGRDCLSLRPQRERGKGEEPGAGANVGDVGELASVAL